MDIKSIIFYSLKGFDLGFDFKEKTIAHKHPYPNTMTKPHH